MKRNVLFSVAGLGALTLASVAFLFSQRSALPAGPPTAGALSGPEIVAAPGRVEPVSEEIEVGSEINGKLREVRVDEGDRVAVGQVLAVLDNDEYRARVSVAEAQVALKEAELRRVINGARSQERREARAAVAEAEAVLQNSRVEWERRLTGYRQGVFSKEEADRAEREFGVARSRHEAAQERYALIEDDAREEDRARAEADLALARGQLAEARARLEKTLLRAPISGVVLRRRLQAGETVSDRVNIPVVTLGDESVLRVRLDVDEADVGKVRIGQRAWVTADAYGDRNFWGRVARIGQQLGRKNVRTDEPSERVDMKILEVLVELEPGSALPAGLRVDGFIEIKK